MVALQRLMSSHTKWLLAMSLKSFKSYIVATRNNAFAQITYMQVIFPKTCATA